MASRKTEKQNMIRNYENEQKEERIQQEFQRRQYEESERIAYDYKLNKELEKQEKMEEWKRILLAESYERTFC